MDDLRNETFLVYKNMEKKIQTFYRPVAERPNVGILIDHCIGPSECLNFLKAGHKGDGAKESTH